MGHIEPQVAWVTGPSQRGLSARSVLKFQTLWRQANVLTQDAAQRSPAGNEAIPVSFKMKTLRPKLFIA
jgi:hypothetical protein